jgi:hypothetical protein
MPPLPFAHAGDDAALAALGDAIRDWEPTLDLVWARDDPMIFEPDGTLYAVGLGAETPLLARHKARAFRRGDMIVVPRSVAIDAGGPGARFVAVRHDGVAPYHFRERFIQTWGYEHRPASAGLGAESPDDVIPDSEVRLRIPYRRLAVEGGRHEGSSGLDAHLLVVLEGRATIGLAGGPTRREAGPDDLALVVGGADYSIEGRAVVGRLILKAEATYEACLAAALAAPGPGPSPEFQPGE